MGVFFGFAGFYMLVRILDKHSFGVWTLYVTIVSILEVIRSGLIQNALIRYLSSSEKNQHNAIISSSILITGTVTLLWTLLNIPFSHFAGRIWNAPELTNMLLLFSITFLVSGILTQLNAIQNAYLNFKGSYVTSMLRSVILFFYILYCYLSKTATTVTTLVLVQLFSYVVSTIISFRYLKEHPKFYFVRDWTWVKRLLNFGKFAFGTSLSSMLSATLDQLMLGALLSPAASGAFNVAVRITNFVDIPTNAVATIVFPQSAMRMKTEGRDSIKYLYEKSVGTILALLIPALTFLYFFSDLVVEFIAGNNYPEAQPILHITLLYCLLIPFARQFGTIIDSIGKPKLNFTIVVFTASLNLGLNYIFINTFGIIGAAYATLLSQLIGFLIAQTVLARLLKVNPANALIYAGKFYPEFWLKYLSKDKAQV